MVMLRTKNTSTAGLRNKTLRRRAVEANRSAAVLPPSQDAMRRALVARLCPWCGKGPWDSVAGHTVRVHGVSSRELHDLAGLTYETSLVSERVRARRIEVCKEIGPPPPGASAGKPRQLSLAAKQVNREKLVRASSQEQRLAAARQSATPEARAKKSAAGRANAEAKLGPAQHGTGRMYRTRKCRCDECRAWNTAEHRRYLSSRQT